MRKTKVLLLFILCLLAIAGYSQDTLKIKRIDSLVSVINSSNFTIQHDSVFQDLPQVGLAIKTYLTAVLDSNELKKYASKALSKTQKDGLTKELTTSSSFYFDQGKLIKVEEFAIGEGKEMHMDWYYSEAKPLYYTLKTDKAKDRAELLLTMADGIQQKFKTLSPVVKPQSKEDLKKTVVAESINN